MVCWCAPGLVKFFPAVAFIFALPGPALVLLNSMLCTPFSAPQYKTAWYSDNLACFRQCHCRRIRLVLSYFHEKRFYKGKNFGREKHFELFKTSHSHKLPKIQFPHPNFFTSPGVSFKDNQRIYSSQFRPWPSGK